MTNLAEFLIGVEQLWPVSGSEEWDTPGLIAGTLSQPITRVLLAVDCSAATVNEAVATGASVLLTHHPLLLRPVTTVREDRYKGHLLGTLIRGNVALVAAHTNADVVAGGVSDVLARAVGLASSSPLVPSSGVHADPAQTGIGRVGDLNHPITLGELAQNLAQALPSTATGIRVAGDYRQPVQRIAVCAGAGDSLLAEQAVADADVYITSDLRHHPAQEFLEQAQLSSSPTALIDISHWAAEWLWLEHAAEQLARIFPDITCEISELRTDPWDFTVVQ